MSTRQTEWLFAVGGAFFLLLAIFVIRGCREKPVPVVEPDTVADTTMVKQRPEPPKTFVQKITKHNVVPRNSVSRGTPDTLLVRRFAAAVRMADSLRSSYQSLRDSLVRAGAPPPPPPVLPHILPSVGGKYLDNGKFELWLTRSDGSILRSTAKLRPNFGFVAGTDPQTEKVPAFWEDRAWVRTLRQVKKCALPSGVMAGVGALVVNSDDRVLGAAVTGGATLLGCLLG